MVNHIAVAVPDCEAAIEWYTNILGFRKLRKSIQIMDRAKNPNANLFRIYGDKVNKAKVAFLTTGNGVGFELFEFIDPKMEHGATFDITRGGFFHIAVTAPDPDSLCEKVIAAGGSKMGETVMPFGPEEDDNALYFQDPWGNTIEVVSCSFEQLIGNRPER